MKCAICGESKGKRTCRLHQGASVCPLCCATVRTVDQCGECVHFQEAERHRKGRLQSGQRQRPEFVMRIDEEVENETDRALRAFEHGYGGTLAEARIRRLYEENPDLCCTQYAMGVVHLTRDEPDQAAEYFQQAVATYPCFAEAHFNLSVCFQRLLQPIKAIRALQEARDVASTGSEIRSMAVASLRQVADAITKTEGVGLGVYLEAAEVFDRGVACMERGDFRQAIAEFRESLRIRPNAHQAYGDLGICYAKLGMREQARAMLDRAIEIDPAYEPAMWNRAALDKSEKEGVEPEFASLEYAGACYLEKKEREEGVPDGAASQLLERLRRQIRE